MSLKRTMIESAWQRTAFHNNSIYSEGIAVAPGLRMPGFCDANSQTKAAPWRRTSYTSTRRWKLNLGAGSCSWRRWRVQRGERGRRRSGSQILGGLARIVREHAEFVGHDWQGRFANILCRLFEIRQLARFARRSRARAPVLRSGRNQQKTSWKFDARSFPRGRDCGGKTWIHSTVQLSCIY